MKFIAFFDRLAITLFLVGLSVFVCLATFAQGPCGSPPSAGGIPLLALFGIFPVLTLRALPNPWQLGPGLFSALPLIFMFAMVSSKAWIEVAMLLAPVLVAFFGCWWRMQKRRNRSDASVDMPHSSSENN